MAIRKLLIELTIEDRTEHGAEHLVIAALEEDLTDLEDEEEMFVVKSATIIPLPNDEPYVWTRDDEATHSLLAMVGEEPNSVEEIHSWTDEQCKEAEEWASAVYLRASDNDNVVVPPRPSFLPCG